MKKTMTNTTIITACLVLISSLGIIAAVPGNVEKAAKETVRREIMRTIACPEFVTENSEANDVKVLVSVNEKGEVSIHEINSANTQLRNYVENTLKEMKIKNSTPIEKFVVVVKFRVA